ncbi:uncharacterized protein MONOS_17698 [Monocercomonoides exilis]|uniref:uncharacterized protein n=1 Tax=Monocercomonoides exilis TaxID=2049356 RepID=UPI0035597F7F|nr:hypothetical protein MONOS_17698 [Monocercomonoides exilis]
MTMDSSLIEIIYPKPSIQISSSFTETDSPVDVKVSFPLTANIAPASPASIPPKSTTPFSPKHHLSEKEVSIAIAQQRPSMEFLIIASNSICILIQPVLNDLFSGEVPSDPTLKNFDKYLTLHGKSIRDKTRHLFHFVCHYAPISIGEIIHSIYLFYQLIEIEEENICHSPVTLVTEDNLGTLLMCGMLLSVKMDRDVPFRNSWWAKLFRIPLSVVNQSELVFLERLSFRMMMEESDFLEMFVTLVGGMIINEPEFSE